MLLNRMCTKLFVHSFCIDSMEFCDLGQNFCLFRTQYYTLTWMWTMDKVKLSFIARQHKWICSEVLTIAKDSCEFDNIIYAHVHIAYSNHLCFFFICEVNNFDALIKFQFKRNLYWRPHILRLEFHEIWWFAIFEILYF